MSAGPPTLGKADTGLSVAAVIFSSTSRVVCGPSPQLAPTTSAPTRVSASTTSSGCTRKSLLPMMKPRWNEKLATSGRSQVARHDSTARTRSSSEWKVSRKIRSAPDSAARAAGSA